MIDFDELENAFLFVSSDQPFMNHAVINRKTGEIFYKTEYGDVDEFPEDVESEDYIKIPHKNDLDLGRDLVFDFVASQAPQIMDKVRWIFQSRGAYSRYKSLLDSIGLLDDWYKFENEQTQKALREWCQEWDLEIK
jgi:hypothetical protein